MIGKADFRTQNTQNTHTHTHARARTRTHTRARTHTQQHGTEERIHRLREEGVHKSADLRATVEPTLT